MTKELKQTTDTIMMVRPAHFGFNEETAANNAFQSKDNKLTQAEVEEKAKAEFDTFVTKLRAVGVKVIVVEDTDTPVKTDAVFPNNWISFHQDGTIVTYPMFAQKRRIERREDILEQLAVDFSVRQRVQMEQYEAEDRFLEGTGSMILDRPNKICYACRSVRTEEALLDEFCEKMGYEKVAFDAVDDKGKPIYHTNVMMAVGETFVVIVMETIHDIKEQQLLKETFQRTGKAIIPLSMAQMMAFAGNMLQVRNEAGDTFLVMSEQAYRSLTAEQIKTIEEHTQMLYSPIPTIETLGGGSARCMMAEVFLPRK